MRGKRLGDNSHDFALDAGGRLTYVDGLDATKQEIKTRLLFFRGEYVLDLSVGVPYFQVIFRKGVPVQRIREILKATILAVPAVVDVPVMNILMDPATRGARIEWEARTLEGTITSQDLLDIFSGPLESAFSSGFSLGFS